MEKTVVVIAANSYSVDPCGHTITFDMSLGKAKSASNTRVISKSLWSCCVEAVVEYCRIVFDLFPDKYQVCVASVDAVKCQPVNSWRDEDQEVAKVQLGLQKFGLPVFHPLQPPHGHPPHTPHHFSPISSSLQGLQYAVRCLAQLTATQYAMSTSTASSNHPLPLNKGRVLFISCFKNVAEVKELEKAIVSMVRSENVDIKQKMDPARLPIHHCQLVIVNTHPPTVQGPAAIRDSPLTQLSSQVASCLYTFPAKILVEKCVSLVKLHFGLRSTIITGIPMKEEQTGASSANYDVELMHLAPAHKDIVKSGYIPRSASKDQKPTEDQYMLKWSTPKSTSLNLQYCSSAYRVTPASVTSRPTMCLINFLLSGKPVLLEQPKKGHRIVSHALSSHSGVIFLHCVPESRSFLDDPPSISEGCGGRITDYRIADFSLLIQDNMLFPNPLDRTKLLSKPHLPLQRELVKLDRETRYWPLTFSETQLYTLSSELDPFPSAVVKEVLTDVELESCKKVIADLQMREKTNEPFSTACGGGGRTKGSKRDEQYRNLWNEIEKVTELHSRNSDRHRHLYDFVLQVIAQCPSTQLGTRKPSSSSSSRADHALSSMPPPGSSSHAQPMTVVASSSSISSSKPTDQLAAWQELDWYQRMTERERKDLNTGDWNSSHGAWSRHKMAPPTSQLQGPPMGPPPGPGGVTGSMGSLLHIWVQKQRSKTKGSHPEFSGRLHCHGDRKELYPSLGTSNGSMVAPMEQD